MKNSTPSKGLFWKHLSFALLLVVFWTLSLVGNTLYQMDALRDSSITEPLRQNISYGMILVLICCGVISIRTLLKKEGETNRTSGIMMSLLTLVHAYMTIVILDGLYFFHNFGIYFGA